MENNKYLTVGDLIDALSQYPRHCPLFGEKNQTLAGIASVQATPATKAGEYNCVQVYFWNEDDQYLGRIEPTGTAPALEPLCGW